MLAHRTQPTPTLATSKWVRWTAGLLAVSAGAFLGALTDRRAEPAAPQGVEPSPQTGTRTVAAKTTSRRVHAAVTPPAPVDPPPPDLSAALGAHFKDGKIITGSTPHRLILFTFDDGPNRRTTPRLLDHLDAAGVRAVFFVTAARIRGETVRERDQQDVLREIVRRGHMVGNHTVDHVELPALDSHAVVQQIIGAEQIIERVLGQRPWLIRPPGGALSHRVDGLLAERGYTPFLWNLGAGDFQVRTPESVLRTWRRVFDRREREASDRGGVVLLHDIHEWSVDAFPLIVQELKDRNCRLLEQNEELYDIVDDPTFFFEPRADGAPHELAGPARPRPEVLRTRQRRLREETQQRCHAVASL